MNKRISTTWVFVTVLALSGCAPNLVVKKVDLLWDRTHKIVKAEIANVGTLPADNFMVSFQGDEIPVSPDHRPKMRLPVPRLANGGQVTLTADFSPLSHPTNNYLKNIRSITVTADSENSVNEDSEDDNAKTVFLQPVAYSQISVGPGYGCGVKVDSSVVCWGRDDSIKQTPLTHNFSQISAGEGGICGLKKDGSVDCWGWVYALSSVPPAIPGSFTQIDQGGWHSCGVKTDGNLFCWGSDAYGQGTPPTGAFNQVTVGSSHSCGIRVDGQVICWGKYAVYFLPGIDVWPPVDADDSPSGRFQQIDAAYNYTCGVRENGSLFCWGDMDYFHTAPPGGQFKQVSVGDRHACALKVDGGLVCWGNNSEGQSHPPKGKFIQVSVNGSHSCGLKANGAVICWGSNVEGQNTPPPPNE